jgi:hypothetical protein
VPLYRLTHPDGTFERCCQADTARHEGVHTTFRGMVLVMGRPREVVLRRVPPSVRVDEVQDAQPDALSTG